jgi:hypothetical protein
VLSLPPHHPFRREGSDDSLHQAPRVYDAAQRRGGRMAVARAQPAMPVVGYIGPASPDDTPYTVVSRCVGSANSGCCPRLELATEVGLRNLVHATQGVAS